MSNVDTNLKQTNQNNRNGMAKIILNAVRGTKNRNNVTRKQVGEVEWTYIKQWQIVWFCSFLSFFVFAVFNYTDNFVSKMNSSLASWEMTSSVVTYCAGDHVAENSIYNEGDPSQIYNLHLDILTSLWTNFRAWK